MGEYYNTIIKVKPGITGPWQIRGRSNISFEDRVKMDLDYAQNSSIKKDVIILFKTFSKVVDKDGAL